MKIALSGSSGFIGSALSNHLIGLGHEVYPLVRRKETRGSEIAWLPREQYVEQRKLAGLDAVIHLAGENIFGRWTESKKRRIYESRVEGTRLLAEAVARATRPPASFICASAIGIYGDRDDEPLTEESSPGKGFLAEVCKEWEEATSPAASAGARVLNLRFGIVLDPSGGALKTMLLPFRLGLGGNLGNGEQYFSWITRHDLLGVIRFVLSSTAISGPINVVAPGTVTNAEFTKTLARFLRRPAALHVPERALRLVLGEMADELLLASSRVVPKRLNQVGFHFDHPDLTTAFQALINDSWGSSRRLARG